MNKIFTQIVLGIVCLFANVANAQVNENFNGTLASCWIYTPENFDNSTYSFTNAGTTTLGTPYIQFASNNVTINFKYRLSSAPHPQKTKTIQVGYQNRDGIFTPFHNTPITVTSTSYVSFNINNNNTFSIPTGIFRIVIKGVGNGSNEYVKMDDLQVTGGTYYYANICNTAPTATDNTFAFQLGQSYTGNFITDGTADSDFNGESLTVVNVSQPDPLVGKITHAANGNFTFVPADDFSGERVTFTYQVKDNGYNSELSNTATVTLTFFQGAILPVHFTSFSGNVTNNKAQLNWNVADNETGSHFEIERSTDGKTFKAISTVFTTNVAGAATYTFSDAGFISNGTFYRIKVVNKDNTTSYSKTIFVKGTAAVDNKLTVMQNPVQSSLNFSFTTTADEASEVAIYNLAGVKMYSQKIQARKGTNSISISLDGKLIRGNYILTVHSASGNKSTQIIKQ